MKIGIDIDNTVVNTAETIIDYINERLPVNLCIDDIKQYYIEYALPDQFRWIVEAAFRDSLMWKKVKLIDGVYDALKEMYLAGHDIYFVTSSSPENFKKKVGHLERVFDFIPKHYVWSHSINIQEKQMLKLDVLIDDFMDNLTGDREYISVCIEYPWNHIIDDENFYRTKWCNVCRLIDLIDKSKK